MMIDTDIGPIISDWDLVKIKDLENFKSIVQIGPFGSLLHSYDYAAEGVPLLLVKNIFDGYIDDSDVPLVNFEKAKELPKFYLEEGDIVITRVGAVGRTVLIKADQNGWMFSGQTLRIRLNSKAFVNKFVELFLRSPQFKLYIKMRSLGTTRSSLNTKIIQNIPIPAPHVNEQKAIATAIDLLDQKIELNHQMNENLEQIAQAICKEYLKDTENIEKHLVGDICNLKYGKMPKKTDKSDSNNDIFKFPIFTGYKISGFHMKLHFKEQQIIVAARGVGGAGDVRLSPKNCFLTNIGISLIPKNNEKINKILLYYLIYPKGFRHLRTGSAQPQIIISDLKNEVVEYPKGELRNQLVSHINTIHLKIVANLEQNKTISEMRDLLLPQLISGKLRIPDPAKFLEVIDT